jgi:uncharacterized glyoxalase superfamily protein PhnB
MEQRLSLITLGVSDLSKAIRFYEDVFGWKKEKGPDGVAFFQAGGMIFGLFPHEELARDMRMSASTLSPYRGFSIAYNARSEAEVDQIFADVKAKGVKILKAPEKVFWGGYSGYFADIDGHHWEVAFNPFWTIDADGGMSMGAPA